ncbi:hypothetical protein BGZ98_005691, partial [Dissophora globulifera]
VKIAAGKTAKITLTFKEPKSGKASQFPLYSGFVVATPKSKGGIAVHVPYTGIKGSISKVPIFDVDNGLPAVLLINDGQFYEPPTGDFTYDLVNDFPAVITRLGSHTPDLQLRVYSADMSTFLGFISTTNRGAAFGWQGRDKNVDTNGQFVFNTWIWGGQVFKAENLDTPPKQLAAGTYRIVAGAQRKFRPNKDFPSAQNFEVYDLGVYKIADPTR